MSKWISVKDKSIPIGKPVYVILNNNGGCAESINDLVAIVLIKKENGMAHFLKKSGYNGYGSYTNLHNILHWREIEIPKIL